jgi:hypothetical protein
LFLNFRQNQISGNNDDDFGYGAEMAAWLDDESVNGAGGGDVTGHQNRKSRKKTPTSGSGKRLARNSEPEMEDPASPILLSSFQVPPPEALDQDFDDQVKRTSFVRQIY